MSTLENLMEKSFGYAEGAINFAFQGGEPTLAGIDFFRMVIELQEKHNKNGIAITNSIQTNGMHLNDEWAKFLSEHKFLVGISLDGPKDIHDLNRIDIQGKGTFNTVMKSIKLLERYNIEFNVLIVINRAVERYPKKIYEFFKRNGLRYLQFIPCLDPLGDKHGANKYSLSPEGYGNFLKKLFDLWYEDLTKGQGISIRYFDNLVQMLMGMPSEACGMMGRCYCQNVIEADGSVYPCDFYVIDQWKLGNINVEGFDEIHNNAVVNRFIKDSLHVDDKCRNCKWVRICRGGCKRNRSVLSDGKLGINEFCEGYSVFFEYVVSRLVEVCGVLKTGKTKEMI